EIAGFVKENFSLSGRCPQDRGVLNIYGCNFAKGEKGCQAVAYLEKTLGISIAASDDITGKDGDWELEIGNAQNALTLNHYGYSLQEICGDGIDNDGDGYPDNFDSDCAGYAPWLCDEKLYQTIRIGDEFTGIYWLYEVEQNPVSMTQLFDLTTAGVGFHPGINTIAYNPVDGFIYGINMYPPYQLYRVNSLGEVQNLGNVTGDITLTSGAQQQNHAGAMADDGTYYVTGASEEL
ncbi:MAG: DUF4347 domain-containing protein, partial [Bacteroides sp.]|nr:DUF4347 domain-containing protein [Bacteroides sp.]